MRYGLEEDRDGLRDGGSLFPAQSSVLDEEVLLRRIVPLCAIDGPRSCRFLTRGDADIYRVFTDGQCYYLKIHRPPEMLARAEAEGQFVTDLASNGIPVVKPVPLRTGGFAEEVNASEGKRPLLVFEEAPPPLPRPPSPMMTKATGETVAQLHTIADSLDKPYDLPVLENKGRRDLLPYLREFVSEEEFRFLKDLAEQLRERFEPLSTSAPDFG